MISADVRRAIARAIAAEGLPAAEPGLRPTGVPGQYASSVAFAFGERGPQAAARIAVRLGQDGGIARAEVTGPGFITVTIAPEELAALPERIAAAGPACAESDALNGATVPAPPVGDPLAEASWEKARAALALQLTARLAAAAGATVAAPGSPVAAAGATVAASEVMERSVSPPDPRQLAVGGEATVRYESERGAPVADPRPAESGGSGRRAWGTPGVIGGAGGDRGREPPMPEGSPRCLAAAPPASGPLPPGIAPGSRPPRWPPLPSDAHPVSRAVAFAGADAVRFSLARAVPGRPAEIDQAIIARHLAGNPAYAVRYAHARAASGVRWAASSPAVTRGERAVPRPLPADPGELVLLDALSWLPERVAAAARRGRPDEFARYLEELASAAVGALIGSGHPGTGRVRPADKLTMAKAARAGLAAGLGLLGVGAPDRL